MLQTIWHQFSVQISFLFQVLCSILLAVFPFETQDPSLAIRDGPSHTQYYLVRQWINQNLHPIKIATYPSSSRPSDFYIPLHSRLGVMSKVYLLALRNSPINCCFLSLVSSLSCAFFAKRAFIFLRFLLSLRSCPIWTIDSCDWNLCWNVQSYMLPLRWRKKWQIASC